MLLVISHGEWSILRSLRDDLELQNLRVVDRFIIELVDVSILLL